MSIASSQWTSTQSTLNRYKTSSRAKSSLLCENVKNYPHRESLVKKSSPSKQAYLSMLSSSSMDSNLVQRALLKNHQHSELVSELSVLDSQSRVGSVTTVNTTTAPKPATRRGSLLGPFKFMTSELEEHKLQHYNKGHLETVLKQLDLLQYLLIAKFEEDRRENEGEIMKAWMSVNEKEEEAFTMSIKEKTAEEVHNVHNRLMDMEKTMEKTCESLAPTFEKFASLNELKAAQIETENYVKSIKKFNVRTKINQEYSERILKLEKSIEYLERTNEKANRMLRTPILEQAKKINLAQRSSSPSSGLPYNKSFNRSASWTSNRALEILSTSDDNQELTNPTTTNKVAVELQFSKSEDVSPVNVADKANHESTTAASVPTSSTSTAENKKVEIVKSPTKPPVPFQERVLRPSWVKEKPNEETVPEKKTEKVPFQEKVLRPSWAKEKPVLDDSSLAISSTNTTETMTSHDGGSSTTSASVHDLAAAAMGLTSLEVVLPPVEERKIEQADANMQLVSSTKSELENVPSDNSTATTAKDGVGSNSSSLVGSPSGSVNQKSLTPLSAETPLSSSSSTTNKLPPAPPSTTTSVVKTERIIVEKKVLSRASWIKDKKDTEDKAASSLSDIPVDTIIASRGSSASDISTSDNHSSNVGKLNRSIYAPKPDSKLTPAAEIPESTVVKSIVSQINTSRTLNSSFYEKKLAQTGKGYSSSTSDYFSSLPTVTETPDKELPEPLELKNQNKKSWKDISSPQYLPIPPPPAPIPHVPIIADPTVVEEKEEKRSNSRGHRRNGSGGAISPAPTVSVPDESTGTQPHPESSKTLRGKSEFGAKSWREFSRSVSNETAQNNSMYQAVENSTVKADKALELETTKIEQAPVKETSIRTPLKESSITPLVAERPPSVGGMSGSAFSSTGSSPTTPKFSPKLNTAFTEPKLATPPITPASTHSLMTSPPATATINSQPSFPSQMPPRITGSRGLISAIRKNAEANSAANTNGLTIGNAAPPVAAMMPPPMNTGSPRFQQSAFRPPVGGANITTGSEHSIPTRTSLEIGKTTTGNQDPIKQSTPSLPQTRSMKEFEMGMNDIPTEIMVGAPSNPSSSKHNSLGDSTRIARVPSGSSNADEIGSATSGYTIDSNGTKRRRPTVKGFVKRVNSLFRTSSQKNVDNSQVISEQNLTQQQLAYMQEKKQSFVEKKIDAETTIVTSTPASPSIMKSIATTNDNDFSFLEHVKEEDDLSSVDQQSEDQKKSASSHAPESSSDGGKQHTSITKRISGLIKKTSSIFQKNAPEPPPRPADLPPLNTSRKESNLSVEKKKMTGIAISPSSNSTDVPPPAVVQLRTMDSKDGLPPKNVNTTSFEVKPILKNGSRSLPRDSERSIPVDTDSLGTIDKIVQQQLHEQRHSGKGEEGEEEDDSRLTDDKFDTNGAPKPRKFKPVKFLKKTFSSMSKMV